MANTPKVALMEVFPVAGKDCMELNLSGAHAPYFTRNVVVLTDDRGNTGVGEVPGGQKITKALEDVKHLVEGSSLGDYKNTLKNLESSGKWFWGGIPDIDEDGFADFEALSKQGYCQMYGERFFDPKIYLWPIPYDEVALSGGKLSQNDGY